ncbi:MAG: NADH-quinone oxidoreductase subunit A [Candidatus Hydrogenedentota bacterium]|nr:MAG: NADH-quinone oxidoreductase subunit A [Candidatus Hydrogenedentota bacterium]
MIESSVIVAVAFGVTGFLFVLVTMAGVGRFVRGNSLLSEKKTSPYECGEIPVGNAWLRYNPRFLILAVVFVLFDIEVALMFPWAAAYRSALPVRGIGLLAFLDMLLFVLILLVGYLWFWNLGELRWILPGEVPLTESETGDIKGEKA